MDAITFHVEVGTFLREVLVHDIGLHATFTLVSLDTTRELLLERIELPARMALHRMPLLL